MERTQVAQTNLQLYNQLREKDAPLGDLVLVHRAYELLTTLYPGHFQADGKPFVAHGVGVASIVAEINQPAEIVAVGLLHNAYGNGDFGDEDGDAVTGSRRELVRAAVGARVEKLLVQFRDLRIEPHNIEQVRAALPSRSEIERRLLCVELADYLEKYVDLGILYWDRSNWLVDAAEMIGDDLVAIASELGQSRLADMLSCAFATTARMRTEVPAELRPSDGRSELKLIVPRSCRRSEPMSLREA